MHGGTGKTPDLPRVYFFGLNKRARRRRCRLRARLILRRGICPEAFFRHMLGSIFTCKHGRFLRRLEKVFYGPAMACFSCKEGLKKDARPQARAPFCINKKRARSAFGSGLCLSPGTKKDAELFLAVGLEPTHFYIFICFNLSLIKYNILFANVTRDSSVLIISRLVV